MENTSILVKDLSKIYTVPEREQGLKASLKSLVKRKNREIKAVQGISFTINQGEIVGFLGPNGAGKTTTLKMLSGLLYPTEGEVTVLGYIPEKRDKKFLRRISLIMGNRNQLEWDIPATDSFELNRAIYSIPRDQFKQTTEDLVKMMDVGDLISKPIRNLSLGERMKMEIIGSLIHRPDVLFLDEPTIGLDVTMQRRLRKFIAQYNQLTGATVILTSHYMADVTALCERIIVIHHGSLLFDGSLTQLVRKFSSYKTITMTFDTKVDLHSYGEIVKEQGDTIVIRVPQSEVSKITAKILSEHAVSDLTVEDVPIDDVIEKIYNQEEEL